MTRYRTPKVAPISLCSIRAASPSHAYATSARSFEIASTSQISPAASAIVTADWDKDGRPDIAIGVDEGQNVTVRYGNGNGAFPTSHAVDMDRPSKYLTTLDANGDGKLDLLAAAAFGEFTVALGESDGRFQRKVSFGTDRFGRRDIRAADLDLDCLDDIVMLRAGGDVESLTAHLNRTMQAVRCRAGNVNDGNGKTRADALRVNDSDGLTPTRDVEVDGNEPTTVSIERAPFPRCRKPLLRGDVGRSGATSHGLAAPGRHRAGLLHAAGGRSGLHRTAARRQHDPTRRRGDAATRRPGDPATRRPGDPATRRPGDPATRRPGDPATRRPGDPATRRPGDPATRRPGDPATRRPGDPATRRPGDPATRRPGVR